MKLLIVEGNNKETRTKMHNSGVISNHVLFQKMLKILEPNAQTAVVFPADNEKDLPSSKDLKKYDGVMWTGSALSVSDRTPTVNQQLNFGEAVFKSGTPLYGSCWGMQIATVVGGGKVAPCSNGLEIGLTKPITLSKASKQSPFFIHRENNYRALCVHSDEVVELPENAIILASNSHSKVQAMTFKYKNSQFFGVQYHPEFRAKDIALISSLRADKLVGNGFFSAKKEVEELSFKLSEQIDLPHEVVNYQLHTQEIRSWLNYIKSVSKN